MKHLKRYFSRENSFSLKERFNMMMTMVTCFFTGVLRGMDKKEMAGKCASRGFLTGGTVRISEWLVALIGWRLSKYESAGGYGKHMPGRFSQKNVWSRMHVWADGQALVDRAGMRGRRGNQIRDVSYEKGLPCMGRWICRGSP